MEGKPRCKRCGRILNSPASIAAGIGSKCAGLSIVTGKSVEPINKLNSGIAFQSLNASRKQIPLFSSESSTKTVGKREMYRQRREERRRLFQARERFQCGLVLPTRKPLIFEPIDDGNWMERPGGTVISHGRLEEYLKRYNFI